MSQSQNNRRIAKNTLMLYVRMLVTMGVTLYTSRVVLQALGVEDYGIYSVVGGVVTMFTVISSSLSSAISRFITFELGRGEQERLNRVFATSVLIQLAISVILVVLVESVGMWYLESKMVIPVERIGAAKWVLHFSLISLVIRLVSIPYNATIIAHERMSAFAYISILEAMGNLAIAYFIVISPIDRLVFYAVMMSAVALVVRIAYGIYCSRHFEECRALRLRFDGELFGEMFAFAGWNFIGSSSALLRDQGGNILLNLYGGPVVNAARSISMQVRLAVTQFSASFMMALNPQITKSYASGDRDYMMMLIFQGSRLSYYMLMTLSLPILLNAQYILDLWLVDVPEHTVLFVQLALIFGLIESVSQPLITAQLATGNIRNYQIVVGGLQMLNLPLSYILLRQGFFPQIVVCVAIFISLCCLASRLFMLRRMIGLSARGFIGKVLFNIFSVSAVSMIAPYLLTRSVDINFWVFVLVSVVAVASSALTIYFIGCSSDERAYINGRIKRMALRI